MGWKPNEFYEETVSDIQIALAAHYDRVDFETIERMSVLRRLTYCIINTGGFIEKEVKESQILELPHERAKRLKEEDVNKYSQNEIKERLERWSKEGPGFKNAKDASKSLLKLVK